MRIKITIIGLIMLIVVSVIVKAGAQNYNFNYLNEPYIFVTQWGSLGDGDGQFGGISIAPDSTFMITDKTIESLKNDIDKDKLAILDPLKNREFDKDYNGEFCHNLEKLNFNDYDIYVIMKAAALKKVNPKGIAGPIHMSTDKSGNIYVLDGGTHRIQKFDSEGNFLTKWGRSGNGKGQFLHPWGIAVDSEEYVYILDSFNHRVQKFDSEGNFMIKWGSYGAFDGQFAYPDAITVSPDNYIYVNNAGINIQKFNTNGEFIKKWNPLRNPLSTSYKSSIPIPRYIGSMAIDINNILFILYFDFNLNPQHFYIHKCNLSENPDKIIGEEIFGEEQCDGIADLTLDTEGNVFAVDSNANCIYKIDSGGNVLARWGSFGSGPGEFNRPEAIAVDSEGNVYVMDTGNYRIQKFAPNPEFKGNQ